MAKIKVRTFDALRPATPQPDEHPSPGVASEALFDADRDPIHARLHHLPAGATLRWDGSRRGHLAYLWDGCITVGGIRQQRGAVVVVEHGAGITVHAEGEAVLLVFNAADACADRPTRAGGHVHLLAEADAPALGRVSETANVGVRLHADSSCPTCELWLHGNDFHDPGYPVKPHYHSEDEVIVVTSGEIVLGLRRYGRGTAVAIRRDTVYGFSAGEDGLSFINFRPAHPSFGLAGQVEAVDERRFYAALPAPTFVDVA